MTTPAAQAIEEQPLRHWFKGSWADRLLLLGALIAIAVSWQWIYAAIGKGPPMVMIYHGDTLLARYPIPEKGKAVHFHAEGELGDSEILIDSSGARFLSSPCNSQYCVTRGQRKEHGDVIACVPNRIMIAIENADGDSAFDAIIE